MSNKTLNVRQKQKYDTSTNWESSNPILLAGEIGIEQDTNKIKVGNGFNSWNDLPYAIDLNSKADKEGKYSKLISGGNVIVDTRDVNSPPSYYANQQTCYEFKSKDVIGLGNYMPADSYVTLKSVKGWTGEGYIVYQEAISAGNDDNAITTNVKCYRYGRNETWGEWQVVGKKSDIDKKLDKLPYEYNKEISFESTGVLYIGKFPIYDTGIVVDISATTSITYSGKLVLACQNYKVLEASVYGDYSNTVTPNIFYKVVDSTVEIYFKPQSWSKNVVRISGCAIRGEVTHICENISEIPTDATSHPVNEFLEVQPQTVVIYDMDSEDENVNRGFTSGMFGTDYIDYDFSPYHTLRIYARLYTSNCVQEVPVYHRKYTDITLTAAASSPMIFCFLKVLLSTEPLLNKLQIGTYGRYSFISANNSLTFDSGINSTAFYVYRIEGIV